MIACNNKEKKNVSDNPLLGDFGTPFNVPPFEKIKPEHFVPAFNEAIKQQTEEIDKITSSPETPTFANTLDAFFKSGALFSRTKSIFYNTLSANTNPELEKNAVVIGSKLAAHRDAIMMNAKLFDRIKSVYDNRNNVKLSDEQTYLLENLYKTFARNGALLNKDKQEELKKINKQLSELTVKYDQNVLAETNDFKLIIENKDDLKGLPEGVIAAAAETAQKAGHPGKWMFTTHKPSSVPFLQYAANRNLREKIYKAYINRGNNDNKNDNKKLIAQIVSLRAKKAQILGYRDYASYMLEPRMAKTPENAMDLLNKLWEKSIKVAKEEVTEMQKIIDKEGGRFKLEAWDWPYYAEKLRKQKYDLDENELRPYFKIDNVRSGIFATANKLYGLSFSKIKDIPLPHPDAEAYEVKEGNGTHLGILYLDFYPRESKKGGAWCNEYTTYHIENGKAFPPVVSVTCNFTKPTKDTPALLSMDEVSTLFHEFGHALESLFAKTTYRTSYSAQDFIELPSQIMEHWAFNKETLKLWAQHYKTNELIPPALVEKMENSTHFNQGFATTEYLAASKLDLAFHMIKDTVPTDIMKFEKEYFLKEGLIPQMDPRYRSTYFTHITGGYDAGYYGYIWAAVLDNDAFEAFKEHGVFDKKTASSFRKNILEKDGIADPVKIYKDFRGRDPQIEPLLKNRGLE